MARYGRIGDEHVAVESGVVVGEARPGAGSSCGSRSSSAGAVNVVVQPGHWRIPRVDHIGVALDEDDFQSVLGRAMQWNLRVQEHGGRRTFVATNAGYRLEVHPPREWIEELLADQDEFRARGASAARGRAGDEGRRARRHPRPRDEGQRGRRRRYARALPRAAARKAARSSTASGSSKRNSVVGLLLVGLDARTGEETRLPGEARN